MKSTSTTRVYSQTARAQSAEATGTRIIEAFLARLMAQWYDEIKLDCVAEDAQVTVQTVIRRFGGKDGLLACAAKVFGQQVNARRAAPPGDIAGAINGLLTDYEQSGDGVIRLLALESRHDALKDVLNFGRSEHRTWVAAAFADPLARMSKAEREQTLDALVIATDVYTWKILRRDLQRSIVVTARTIKQLIQAAIPGYSE